MADTKNKPKSKVIVDKAVLIAAYNKLFAKWGKAKGVKKAQLWLELEKLNDKI